MAKKSRRVKKKGHRVHLSAAQMVQPVAGDTADAPVAATRARPGPKVADLQEEYRYVIADLKRIGIIAVAMLVVLVALAFLFT